MTVSDVELAVELFYLPYEHGKFGRKMVKEFLWLQGNIRQAVIPPNAPSSAKSESMDRVGCFHYLWFTFLPAAVYH